jgi:hypothetical protein
VRGSVEANRVAEGRISMVMRLRGGLSDRDHMLTQSGDSLRLTH